ncbi:MAG: hypothetical protein K8R75_02715 [Deltaproteobacteria bacterium]|nr:hypothetical protein [Deltaproteobacteria bacterium]
MDDIIHFIGKIAQGLGVIVKEIELGPRMTLAGQAEPLELGEVLHTFLAADRTTCVLGDIATKLRYLTTFHIPHSIYLQTVMGVRSSLLGLRIRGFHSFISGRPHHEALTERT